MSLTPLDKQAMRRSFDRAASGYDQHAVLQREVESRLLERIEFQRLEPRVILDLGSGTGSASHLLAGQFKKTNVISLDWSPAMLKEAGNRQGLDVNVDERLSKICADMHRVPLAAQSVDLVFSNLALQWSYDFPAIISELRRIMKVDAMLVFSCYGPDTLYELKQSWQAVDVLPHVNDYPDMHNVGDELVAAGYREPVMDVERLTLEYPDVHSLMRDLKGLGSHNVASHRLRGLTGKTRLKVMLQAYEQFRRNGRYPASFEVIYGTAFAPFEGQPMKTPDGDIATFSVDALRTSSRTKQSS